MSDRLEDLHQQIEDLTDPDGEYAVVCPLSGKRPVPVRGKSFPTPDVATDAVDLVVEYRKLLREVDPHLENVPIVACREVADSLSLAAAEDPAATELSSRERDNPGKRDNPGERDNSGKHDHSPSGVDERANARDLSETVTLSGDDDEEWLRLTDAPVVRIREDGEPLDDAVIGLALNAKL